MAPLDPAKPEFPNQNLRIHFVNVNHGDAIILDLPDYPDSANSGEICAHYAVVDTGRSDITTRDRLSIYLQELINCRNMKYCLDFVCITHPHEDHYGGLNSLLAGFKADIRQFWDCGFRTTAVNYNKILDQIAADDCILFLRPAAGMEFEFGKVHIYALGPSLDLRNRFDTYGVDRNNASIVLKLQFQDSLAILAGDAFLDSWAKIVEEFPRSSKVTFAKDASVIRSEGDNQLKCQLLKVAHHGSKHGTSLEYLEKLGPTHFMITCADKAWYDANEPSYGDIWPHELTSKALQYFDATAEIKYAYQNGNVVYKLDGTTNLAVTCFMDVPGEANFVASLAAAL